MRNHRIVVASTWLMYRLAGVPSLCCCNLFVVSYLFTDQRTNFQLSVNKMKLGVSSLLGN